MTHLEEAEERTYKHWTTVISEEAIQKFGNNQVVATGWAPSGYYQIGNFKEGVTCRAIHRELINLGAKSRFIINIDDIDTLDKIPAYFKKEYDKMLSSYLGHAINEVPDPLGCHSSYADHFIADALSIIDEFDVNPEPILVSDEYKLGKYDKYAKLILEKKDEVSDLMEEITGSRMEEFFLIQCPHCKNINGPIIKKYEFTPDGIIVDIHCRKENRGCDKTSTIKLGDTLWKLKWRVDWAARQDYLGVTVESSGKDHGVAGGSIDSSLAIHKRIFNKTNLPLLIQHGFLTSGGKKLSGGTGSGMPVSEFPKILEPSIFLYKIYRHNLRTDFDFKVELDVPNTASEFDNAEKLYYESTDIEHKKTKEKTIKAYELALINKPYAQKPIRLEYGHLVTVLQVCLLDEERTLETLKARDLIPEDIKELDLDLLKHRLQRAKYWVSNYADDKLKFQIVETPICELIKQIDLEVVEKLLKAVEILPENLHGDDITQFLYNFAKEQNIKPGDFFKAIYIIVLGKKAGPRAGTLIDILGRKQVSTFIKKALSCI